MEHLVNHFTLSKSLDLINKSRHQTWSFFPNAGLVFTCVLALFANKAGLLPKN